jgi:hypothetical protein
MKPIKLYMAIWVVLLSSLLGCSAIYPGAVEALRFAYFIFTSVSICLVIAYSHNQLVSHLKRYHLATFNKLTVASKGDHRFILYWRLLRFINSDSHRCDPTLTCLKMGVRYSIRLGVGVFLHYPLIEYLLRWTTSQR